MTLDLSNNGDYTYAHAGRVLKLDNVGVSFFDEDGRELVVIRSVTAEILNITRPNMQQGQVVALLGPSGVGKTQLFRRMAGLSIPGAKLTGNVYLGEKDTPVTPGLVGVVAQSYPLFDHRTVRSNLLVAAHNRPKPEAEQTLKDLCNRFELEPHLDKFPAQLSGGQRQRVAIAQQLMSQEFFLLLDEPFSGLDPLMTQRVIELVQQVTCLNEYNTTIIVTHDISSAIAVADMLWVMGRDRNPDGSVVPGAYIKRIYDLAAMGLAWRPNIRKDPRFAPLANELRDLFPTL